MEKSYLWRDSEGTWYLISEDQDSVEIPEENQDPARTPVYFKRKIDGGLGVPEKLNQEPQDDAVVSLEHANALTGLTITGFDWADNKAWATAGRKLKKLKNLKQEIPITPLREFYKWLRFSLRNVKSGKEKLSLFLAEEYCRNSKPLETLFFDSLKAFKVFENVDDAFHPLRNNKQYQESTSKGTTEIQKAVEESPLTFTDSETGRERTFRFVDREVSTTRVGSKTKNWISREKSIRLDLLLAESINNNSRQMPIVGEIKYCDDATPFVALIQAMTYATELVTRPQWERLKKHCKGEHKKPIFTEWSADPSIGLLILAVNSPSKHEDVRKLTLNLLSELYKSKEFRKTIPTTVWLEATFAEGKIKLHGEKCRCFGNFQP